MTLYGTVTLYLGKYQTGIKYISGIPSCIGNSAIYYYYILVQDYLTKLTIYKIVFTVYHQYPTLAILAHKHLVSR